MIKKIILSIVVISVLLLTTSGVLYASNKNQSDSKKNNQEISQKDVSKSIFHITSSCNNGGTISLKGNQALNKGDDITFTITAKTGYKLVWLRVDNVKMKDFPGGTYTFTDVDKNHTIHALFKKIKANNSGKK